MASPAKIAETLPDTLPEDFGDWDGGESPAAPGTTEAEPGSGSGYGSGPKKPPARPVETLKPAADLLHGAPLPSPAKDYTDDGAFLHRVKSLKPAVEKSSDSPSRRQTTSTAAAVQDAPVIPVRSNGAAATAVRKAPAAQAAAISEADEVLFNSFHGNAAEATVQTPSKKKWTMIAVAGGVPVLLLLLLAIPMFRHGKTATARPATAPLTQTVITQEPSDADASKPSPSAVTSSTSDKHAAANNTQDTATQNTADAKPAETDQDKPNPSPVQSQMMNAQLNAPSRIQRASTNTAPDAPPSTSFGMAGMGGNGAIGNVFGSQKGPNVQVAQPSIIRVSAGVAVGLLVQKTAPIYPPIAMSARVSGTVVLQATISKTGTIKDLHVISGPAMLRQSAMDAVRTWHYKPYKLNNEPTEIETTINVIFSLGG